jgi:hypothetical protein
MFITTSGWKEALMDEHILQAMAGHPETHLAIPYVRGLMQVIQQQRIDLILARTYRISAINRLRLGTCSLQKME